MIDIEKEREAFEESHNVHPDGTFYFHAELKQYIAIDGEMELTVDSFNEHWDTWLQCVEFKQVEIDDLEESRMTWRDYAMKIESGEYELVKKDESEKCIWRENEDGIWDTACGQDYVFDGYATEKPSDSGQYCSNCGKKIEDVPFEDIEHD